MNALMKPPANMGQMSTQFAGMGGEDDLSAGISGGFGRVGFKGKVWSIHHRGESRPLLRNDGSGDPLGSIEVVLLKASSIVSKTYYKGGFVEGSTEAPDCMSTNGITPDATAPNKQAASCALCPMNRWGSDIRQDGTAGKGKACKDTKRIAVVPLADIDNDLFGGPMLLRVPAASLQDVATYGKAVAKLGYHYYAVATRIGFDPKEAFPKLVFSPIRALTDEEATKVIAHRNDTAIDRILAEDTPVVAGTLPAPEEPTVQFEQQSAPVTAPAAAPQPTPVTAPVAAPVAAPAPATTKPRASRAAKPAAAPAPTPTSNDTGSAFDAALDDELAKLMGDA